MGADPAEENLSLSKLKSEAVVGGHGTFPSIGGPDESFDPEGRVAGIAEKKKKGGTAPLAPIRIRAERFLKTGIYGG